MVDPDAPPAVPLSAATPPSGGLPAGDPFAEPSTLPFRLPPFDRIRAEHFAPAFEAGMAAHRAEIAAIGANPEPPSFANTVEAMERAGGLLERVGAVFFNLTGSVADDALDAIEARFAPLLAAHHDAVRLDPALFARVDAVHAARADRGLDAEQVRLVERHHRDLVRAGAGLDEARQQRLREINAELSSLTTAFRTRLVADTNAAAVHLATADELAGLPDDAVAASRAAATASWTVGWSRSSCRPGSRHSPRCAVATCASGCTGRPSPGACAATTTTPAPS